MNWHLVLDLGAAIVNAVALGIGIRSVRGLSSSEATWMRRLAWVWLAVLVCLAVLLASSLVRIAAGVLR